MLLNSRSIPTLAVASLSLLGCEKIDFCAAEDRPEVCDLQVNNENPQKIWPSRFDITANKKILLSSTNFDKNSMIQLSQEGAVNLKLPLIQNSEGGLEINLQAADLIRNKFHLGEAQIVINNSDIQTIRFYLNPKYLEMPNSTLSSDKKSLWVGIGKGKKLFSIDDALTGMTPIHFVRWNYGMSNPEKRFGALYGSGKIKAARNLNNLFFSESITNIGVAYYTCPVEDLARCRHFRTEETSKIDEIAVDGKNRLVASRTGGSLFIWNIVNDSEFKDSIFSDQIALSADLVTRDKQNSLDHLGIGDIDSDGNPDIIASLSQGRELCVFQQINGNYQYSSELSDLLKNSSETETISALSVADIDGDGWDDVAIASGKVITWLINQGRNQTGKLQNFIEASNKLTATQTITTFSVGNVDEDAERRADIVLSDTAANNVLVYINAATR